MGGHGVYPLLFQWSCILVLALVALPIISMEVALFGNEWVFANR